MMTFTLKDLRRHLPESQAQTMKKWLFDHAASAVIGMVPSRGAAGAMMKQYDTNKVWHILAIGVIDKTSSHKDWSVYNKYFDIVQAIKDEA